MFGKLVALTCLTSVLAAKGAFEAGDRFDTLEALVRGLDNRLRVVENENKELRRTCGLTRDELSGGKDLSKRQFTASTVAFTAVVTQGTISNLQGGQQIVFDKVITNVGSGYDDSTGIFTAPVSGVYGFNFAMMSEPNTREYLQIVKDGQHIVNNFAHSSTINIYSSSSRTVTLDLQKGNQVWIQTPPDFDHGDGSIHGNEYTTFTGWLVAFTE